MTSSSGRRARRGSPRSCRGCRPSGRAGSPGQTTSPAPWVAVVPLTRMRSPTHRAAVAADRLPDAAGVDPQLVGLPGTGVGLIDLGEGAQMMAEIARGGEVRRLAVFVAAIAGDPRASRRAPRRSSRCPLASSAKEKRRRLSARCSRSPSRAPTITAATACCSRTQRVATLAIDTPCFFATSRGRARIPAAPPSRRSRR